MTSLLKRLSAGAEAELLVALRPPGDRLQNAPNAFACSLVQSWTGPNCSLSRNAMR